MSLAKTIIIKSNMNCNLRCKYCYEFNRNGEVYNKEIINPTELEEFIARTARLFPDSRFLWMLHGGEPLINGLDYFKQFIAVIRRMIETYSVEFKIALQTNATLLTDEWIAVLEENIDLLSERIVSVSIDGPKNMNDEVRVNAIGKGSYDGIISAIEKLKKSNLVFTTISVVGEHNVHHPKEVYDFLKELKPNMCKFIPCYNYDEHGKKELFGILPSEYARFMCQIYDLWIKDLPLMKDEEWFVIDPIATIISKLSGVFVTWCEFRSEKCDNFVCLYPDGELWLCDTYNHDTTRKEAFLGNIRNLSDEKFMKAFESPTQLCHYKEFYEKMTKKCEGCDIYQYCVGGCIPYRSELENKSIELYEEYCKGKHILINHIKESVDLALFKS